MSDLTFTDDDDNEASEYDLIRIEAETAELLEVEGELELLKELQQGFATLVNEQAAPLQKLTEQIQAADTAVSKGTEELSSAQNIHWSTWKWKLALGVSIGVVCGGYAAVLYGVKAALGTFGIAAVTSAVL